MRETSHGQPGPKEHSFTKSIGYHLVAQNAGPFTKNKKER